MLSVGRGAGLTRSQMTANSVVPGTRGLGRGREIGSLKNMARSLLGDSTGVRDRDAGIYRRIHRCIDGVGTCPKARWGNPQQADKQGRTKTVAT